MPHTYRNAWAVLILITTLLLLTTGRPAHAAPELTVGDYQLVSSARISRTVSEYTYKAAVINTGSDALDVSATLNINAPGVTVLDGELSFGDVGAGATVSSADTFTIRHDRVYAYNESLLEWTTRATQPLAPPSDPLVIDLGNGEFTLEINTQVYEGLIDVPLPDGVTLDTLSIEVGIDVSEPVSSDGRFNARMNDNATGLLRAVDSQGNTILMQVFPKAEALVRVNPQITSLSTAVALVALQPGLITNDPLIDALIVAILEQLPETKALANTIAAEIAQGTFALSKDYSPDVAAGIGQVLHRLTVLSEAISQVNSIEDILAKNSWDKLIRHIEHFASKLIKPAHANAPLVAECTDIGDNFTGHPGTRDDVCISANIAAAGSSSSFDITNQRTRWVFLGKTDASGFESFKTIPARHIDIPTATSLLKLAGNVVVDLWNIVINTTEGIISLNFKDIFKVDSKVIKQFSDAKDKLLYGHKTSAQYKFDQNGEYLLSTLGISGAPFSTNQADEKYNAYRAGSFLLTTATEFAIPFALVFLDISLDTTVIKENDLDVCFVNNSSFILNQVNALQSLHESGGAENIGALAEYVIINFLVNPSAWAFVGCIFDDLLLMFTSAVFKAKIEIIVNNFGSPIALANKMASSVEAATNLALFFGVLFDKDLASEDFYRVKIGNTTSSGSFQIGSRVELSSTAGTLIVYDAPEDGNVKGIQAAGVKGTVVEETTLADGSKWWNVDFDEGVDGWVTGNALKPIGGATGTLLSSIAFTDANLGQCVLDAATANGWQTVEQVTALSCANRTIANLTGIENLQALQTLVLSDNQISVITPLRSLTQLKQLNLSGNSGIQCTELDALAAVLTSIAMTRPADCVQSGASSFIWPVTNFSLTQAYAAYNAVGNNKYHAGFDLAGDPAILAAAAGTVRAIPNHTFANENHNMGNVVIIDHNNGQGPFTLYAHLASIDVANDTWVKAGDVIGVMGDTGCANLADPCGIHLHFEVKQKGTLGNLHDDSDPYGYTPQVPNLAGYLNPWPYLDHGWAAYTPKAVRALADQIVRTGPGTEYAVVLGNVAADQIFVATQQVGNWYEIDFPGEAGPAKGWIQAEPVGNVQRWRVTDPTSTTVGVSVCPTASACASSPNRLSYAWNQQQLVQLESAPAQNGCTKPWIRTSLLDNQSGWVCGDFLTIGTVLPTATGKLNDTGITTCANDFQNGLPCPVHGFPGQDGEHGRDALAAAGLLQKVGGGSAGFDFTKLDADGNPLPASATEWSCVKDNHTGLIWEEKTTSGLRSMHHTYTWYNPDSSNNGGDPGVQNGGNCTGSSCDTHGYVQAVNAQGLCGANDWRMPTRELGSLVDYSRINPAIDTDYFPHTPSNWFWGGYPDASNVNRALTINLTDGYGDRNSKSSHFHVRLVRDGQ